jgi:hypothetical protein
MSNMESSDEPTTPTKPNPDPATQNKESNLDDDEFKIIVRKLDRVVRPRGVLAE